MYVGMCFVLFYMNIWGRLKQFCLNVQIERVIVCIYPIYSSGGLKRVTATGEFHTRISISFHVISVDHVFVILF